MLGCVKRAEIRRISILRCLGVCIALGCVLLATGVLAADGGSTIRGLIYSSQTGKLEGELVLFAIEREVMLLPAAEVFDRELDAIRQSRAAAIAKQRELVRQAQLAYYNTINKLNRTPEEREKSTSRLIQERAELTTLKMEYERQVQELLNKHALAKTVTDSGGNFEFSGVRAEHYLIYSHLEIAGMGIHHYWLVPVKVGKASTVEVTLNNLNTTPLYQY